MVDGLRAIETLTIGPCCYRVTPLSDLHLVSSEGVKEPIYGQVRSDRLEIRINADCPPERQIVTLWHETIHAILNHAGHTDHDEDLVIALAFGLVQAMRDNPELVAYTMAKE